MMFIEKAFSKLFYYVAPKGWSKWSDARRPQHLEVERLFLSSVIEKGELAVDVGAHQGLYARALVHAGARKVLAFEPFEEVSAMLRRTTGSEVLLFKMALSDRKGSRTIAIPLNKNVPVFGFASLAEDNDFQGHAAVERRNIIVSTIDEEVKERCSFIKIDVEGHELDVLNGAKGIIEKYRPIFLVESESRHSQGSPKSIFDFFRDFGYSGWFIHDCMLQSVEIFDGDKHQSLNAIDFRGVKKDMIYVNNFFFIPDGSHKLERLRIAVENFAFKRS